MPNDKTAAAQAPSITPIMEGVDKMPGASGLVCLVQSSGVTTLSTVCFMPTVISIVFQAPFKSVLFWFFIGLCPRGGFPCTESSVQSAKQAAVSSAIFIMS